MNEIKDLQQLFKKAVNIECRIPFNDFGKLGVYCQWPDYLYDIDDRIDWDPHDRKPLIYPTPKEITLLDKAYELLGFLGNNRESKSIIRKKIIWLKAKGLSYRKIERIYDKTYITIRTWYLEDIQKILNITNRKNINIIST